MASMKRASDDESEAPPGKIARRDDSSADDDGSKTRTGRIRKKSAKVLEMEEFEEIEKKQFSKKTDGKSKALPTVSSAPGSTKKIKVKGPGEEVVAPVVATVQPEALVPGLSFQEPAVAQESVTLTPVKTSKQATSTKVRDGQGSVIKLLLSSPALPTTPSITTNVVSKTSPPVTVSVAAPSPAVIPAITVKKATAKVKAEPIMKQEPGVTVTLAEQHFPLKAEVMDPQATQNLLGVTLAVAQDNPLSPPQTAVKSEPGAAKTPKAGAGSLKMKLMMSPKDSPGVVDSVIATSGSIPAMFFGRDETDGTPADDTGNSSGKKKPPAKKKKATAASEKTSKQTSKSPSAAEQMPNLAALVSGPKSKKGVKEEPNLSLSDHIDTSMSDASLDMSSIVDSALDMEEEAALVIAEGAAAASSKQKKKRSNTSGRKKAKAAAAELHGFDSDEDTTAPPDGDLATLAAKVQRGSSAAGSKKKSAKKLHEAAAQRVSMQGKKKRPPRRAPTAYMLYCNSQRPKVVAESPGIEDVSEAIERFLEQVAASNSTNRDDPSKSKDKEREVKRASKMIIPPECKCHLNNGRPCHTRFSVAELMDTRMHYMTISKKELDIAVLAKLECGIHLSRMTTRKKRKPTERKKHRTDFYHRGYRICNLIFVYLHGFSYKKLKALIIQYKTNGVKTRIHKNLKPKPLDGEKKLKKKKLKPKPKPKEPKEKKPRVKKTKETKTKAEEKKDKNAPEFRPMAVSQPKPVVPQAMTHTQLPPPPSVHPSVTFPIPSQHNPPHPPAFPITAKHNPTPAFPHTVSVSYNNPPVFPHHPMAGHHPHPHPVVSSHNNPPLDYSNQRGMSNPPLDFSNQRNNPNNLAVFSGTNPHGLTYSVVHSVNF